MNNDPRKCQFQPIRSLERKGLETIQVYHDIFHHDFGARACLCKVRNAMAVTSDTRTGGVLFPRCCRAYPIVIVLVVA